MRGRKWMLCALLLLSACAAPSAATIISLTERSPLPSPPEDGIVPLRVSVAAVVSPRGTLESYQPLLDYLSQTLHRPVELVQRRTYAETNALIESGAVDLAFVCTSAYILGHADFGMSLLVAPKVNGSTVYHSVLIVPHDSPARKFEDLRGKVFAFTDPMSNTGRVYPSYLVEQLGESVSTFFARTFFTYNHDDAIRAVADKLADGTAVDSLVYDHALERDPSLADKTRIIHRSPPFGIPPVVVSPNLRPQTRLLLQETFLNMHTRPEGREALRSLKISSFVLVNDSAYDSARQLFQRIGALR